MVYKVTREENVSPKLHIHMMKNYAKIRKSETKLGTLRFLLSMFQFNIIIFGQ